MASQTRTGARSAAPTSVKVTQTYSTTDTVLPAAVSPLVLTATNVAAKTPSATLTDALNTNAGTVATSLDQAQADLGARINAVITDANDTKQVLNLIIDALQAYGILS